ncbi:hypothetical protein DBQ08_03725 [Lacticaseibacillus rhamnosus]|jgi:hypothetical protein|nr:hypothetical protein DBQ08_03725 [Lacticaseibacillus rhamnosus]
MTALWPLRLRFLHADFCASERVNVSVNQPTDEPANALKLLNWHFFHREGFDFVTNFNVIVVLNG